MIKYILLIILLTIGATVLMHLVGVDAHVLINSYGPSAGLNFEARVSWRAVIACGAIVLVGLLIIWSIFNWIITLPGRLMNRDD